MPVFQDQFTGTATTALTSHPPTGGSGSWLGSTNPGITNANRARNYTGSSGVSVIESNAPAASDYDTKGKLVVWNIPAGGLSVGFISHADTNANTEGRFGYHLVLGGGGGGTLTLKAVSGGSATLGTVTGATWNTGGGATAVYECTISPRASGTDTIISCYVTRSDGQYLKSDGTYQASPVVACITATLNSSDVNKPGGSAGIPAIGKGGIVWLDTNNSDSAGVHIDDFTVTDISGAGTASVVSAADTSISVIATSGAGAVSQQWQRSTSAVGTFTDLSGKTSLSCTDSTPVAGTQYFYRCAFTDGVPSTLYSNVIAANTWGAPIVFGFIGDSRLTGVSAGDVAPTIVATLAKLTNLRQVTLGSNAAVSGSATSDWVSGAGSGYMTSALSLFSGANVTDVYLMLGTNGRYDANYTSDMASIIATLLAVPYRVWIGSPFWASALTDQNNQDFYEMQALASALVNGTTVMPGDLRLGYQYIAANPTELVDGIHLTATGKLSIGLITANAIDASLNADLGGIATAVWAYGDRTLTG